MTRFRIRVDDYDSTERKFSHLSVMKRQRMFTALPSRCTKGVTCVIFKYIHDQGPTYWHLENVRLRENDRLLSSESVPAIHDEPRE